MTREQKKQAKRDGDALADLIDGMIYDRDLTGVALADATGKSEAQVSMIRNPLHGAQWTIADLPVLVRILDGKRIARAVCSLVGQVNVDLHITHPTGTVTKETGELLAELGRSLEDGELTLEELRRLKTEVSDLYGAVSAAEAAAVEGRRLA